VAALPGLSRLVRALDATRDERDRLRQERDRLRQERDRLRQERDRLRAAADGPVPPEADPQQHYRELSARLGRPSFYAHLEALRRARVIAEREHGRRDPVWDHNAKDAGYALARSLGLRVPAQIAAPAPLDALREPAAERVVVKPVEGAAARGVMPLVRADDGNWHLLFELGRTFSWAEIRGLLDDAVAEGGVGAEFLVEELIEGPTPLALPYDCKVYCIGGRAELIMQRDPRNRRWAKHASMRFLGRDFVDLGLVRHRQRHDPSVPLPAHPAELLDSAERIAGALPTPFVRVDLYEAPDGVVFSEITPQPGGYQLLRDDVDERLGEAWDRTVAAQLAARPADTGQ
jgi:hypothetical protein